MGPDHPQGVSFSELINADRPARPVLEAYSTVTGPLPASGRPHDRIYMQRNPDYLDDTDLCFEVGNSETRVRLAPADKTALLGLLYSAAPTEESAALTRKFLDGMLERQLEVERAQGDSVRAMRQSHLTQSIRDVIELLEQS